MTWEPINATRPTSKGIWRFFHRSDSDAIGGVAIEESKVEASAKKTTQTNNQAGRLLSKH